MADSSAQRKVRRAARAALDKKALDLTVLDVPGRMGSVSNVPPRSVTVWGRSLVLFHVTVAPSGTESSPGW